MIRYSLVVLLSLAALPACAQEAEPPTRIYVAYYQVSYGDLLEWVDSYYQNSVPVLDGLVQEGVITNYNARMHNTGGKYNLRQGFVGSDETNFDEFWEKYLARLAETNSTAFERGNRMILAHQDEIWNLDVLEIPDGAATKYLYDAQFLVNFADLEDVNRTFTEVFAPALDQAITDGIISGYVVQSHNTGGDYNWKMLSLVDRWDMIDDLQEVAFGAAPLDHPFWKMFTAHRDELWEALPPPS